MEKIIINKIKCKTCGDIIESKTTHDYQTCSCRKVSVDGGKEYLKRNFPSFPVEKWYEELSVCEEDNENENQNNEKKY